MRKLYMLLIIVLLCLSCIYFLAASETHKVEWPDYYLEVTLPKYKIPYRIFEVEAAL